MTKYFSNILIDRRTTCSKDEAAAILLGRRSYDPIYSDLNPDGDPDERDEQFLEWLDISIFDELLDERYGILGELEDARDEEDPPKIDACRERVIQCDETIRRAKRILCDIDDELAKGAKSQLRAVQEQRSGTFNPTPITLSDLVEELAKGATSKSRPVNPQIPEISNTTRITLSSLRRWAAGKDYLTKPLEAATAQPVPPAPEIDTEDEPFMTKAGGMTAKSAQSFLVTFAILVEQFVAQTGNRYIGESGTGVNKKAIIDLLWENSLPGARFEHFLTDQSKASIKKRLDVVIEKSASLTAIQRAKSLRSKIATPKS